jgi:UDP-2,3-diacylglucosamine hydrolase
MNRTLFISDLHLGPAHPKITALFLQFIATQAQHADALYILGDLFEIYIGDDEKTELYHLVSQALAKLKKSGVPIYLMHGNRDFLIGKSFVNACEAVLLQDPTLIYLYGKPTLLMHGDTLCTQDKKYLAFRQKAQNPRIQKFFLMLPLKIRQQLAKKARNMSHLHTQQIPASLLDVTPDAVRTIMQKHQVHQLIHGHTHRPSIHDFWLHKKHFRRIVLSDWGNEGHFLAYDENGLCRLESFEALG